MCVFNEADILPWTLKHLIEQGVDVHVIDNWSTDGSDRIAQQFPLAGFERFPARRQTAASSDGAFSFSGSKRWRSASQASWCIHHDADEIRRSSRPDESLLDALRRMDARRLQRSRPQGVLFSSGR